MTAWLAPRIVHQPTSSEHITVHRRLTLSITATGANTLKYQWIKAGQRLSDDLCYQGSKTSSLQIYVTSIEQGGSYHCEVSNDFAERILSRETTVQVDITGKGEKHAIQLKINCHI